MEFDERITNAAATTGPAKGPRPASSTPITKCLADAGRLELRARSSRVRGNEGGRVMLQEGEVLSAIIRGIQNRDKAGDYARSIAVSKGVFASCFSVYRWLHLPHAHFLKPSTLDLQTEQSRGRS